MAFKSNAGKIYKHENIRIYRIKWDNFTHNIL